MYEGNKGGSEMTGFDSKRQMAQAKVQEEMQEFFTKQRQAEQAKLDDDADTLLIVYQRGFADGKRAAQRKPLTDEEIWQIATDCTIGGDLHADKFARAIENAHNIKEGT
jgi:hypothetical protein